MEYFELDGRASGEIVDKGFRAPFAASSGKLALISTFRISVAILITMEIIVVCLFGACTKITIEEDFTTRYHFMTATVIMMFFGFGYLMTFLKRYGMGSVGFTMLLTALVVQWGILVEGFFHQVYYIENHPWHYIHIDTLAIMDGIFTAASVLISFGGVIGKATPLQLIVMAVSETVFFAINKRLLCMGVVEFVDAGGTINIHMFGAYFGLAVAWWLGKPATSAEAEGGHVSDLFSLLGTIFLWVYWPSFNAGPLEPESDQQQRAVVNTILALSFCVTSTFLMSSFLSSTFKFRPVDIQNATIAAGVAIGAVADFTLSGSDVALIGWAAGALSTFGFNRVQEFVEHKFSIHDTCGIHNLHGMPSLLGGVISVIVTAIKSQRNHDFPPMLNNGRDQSLDQFIAILFTLGVSISSGFITGWVMSKLTPQDSVEAYSDSPWWDVMDDFGRDIEEAKAALDAKLNSSLLELQLGLQTAKKLQDVIVKYEHDMGEQTGGSDDSDSDSEEKVAAEISSKLSNLVPSLHKSSTMFGAGHKKSSMTTSRHGTAFTGQRTLASAGTGRNNTRKKIGEKNLNSSRHSSNAAGANLNNSRHSYDPLNSSVHTSSSYTRNS